MPDLAKTRRALIDQVLANLHVLAEGQTPAAEDVAKVDRIIDPVFAQLAARDIAYVPHAGAEGPSGGAIDLGCFLLVAHPLALDYPGSMPILRIAGAADGEVRNVTSSLAA